MARTYVLQSTAAKGGGLESWREGTWNNFSDRDQYRAGQLNGSRIYATYYMFDAATLASLASKPIVSVTLNLTVVSGIIPRSTATFYPIGYKYTTVTGGSGSNTAWQRSNEGQTAAGTYAAGYVRTTGNDQTANNTSISISLSTHVPKYGVVIGPGSGTQYDTAIFLASSATLTIVTNEYTINYNKGSYGSGTNTSDIKTHGTALTLKGAIFSRTGYTQTGWSTTDGGSKAYNLSGSYTANADATLYPYWTANTYPVNYNKGSHGTGTNTSDTKTYGVALTLKGAIFTRTGYTQVGWATSDGGAQAYALSASYTTNASVTLYPVWKANTYPVSYNANGGTGAPAAQTKTYGVTLTLSSTVPTRSGYIFQGWATSASGAVAYQPGGSYTANAAVTLYAVWQGGKSTISTAPNTYIGNAITVTWSNVSSAVVNKIKFVFGSASSGELSASGTSHQYTLPTSWLNQIPNATSGTAMVYLYSYFDGVLVGTDSKTFTASAKSTVIPSIGSISATKVNPQWNLYLQKYSKVKVAVSNCAAGQGATIASYSITGRKLSYSVTTTATSADATSDTLDAAGSFTYTVRVTDSRGRYAERTVTITVTGYAEPAITSVTGIRCNSDGTANPTTGTSIKAMAVYTWSAVGSNALTTTLSYKKHSASSYTQALTTVASGTAYVIAANLAEIASSYDVKLEIVDSLNNKATYTIVVPPVVGIAFGLKNDRARFGGPVEKAGLQIDWPTEINNTLDITPRRCYATLSSAGWYRVLTYGASSTNDVQGGRGLVIKLNIQKATGAENHSITLRTVSGSGISFVDESSKSYALNIDKIRYTYDTTKAYIDIHYNSSTARDVGVDFDVCGSYLIEQRNVTANNLEEVADAPSGETVLTEYTFAANVSAGRDIDMVTSLGVALATGINLNSITEPGRYYLSTGANTISNLPYTGNATGYFDLVVMPRSSSVRVWQILLDGLNGNIYQRRMTGASTWSAWTQL